MSTTKKPSTLEGLSPQERLDGCSVLFRFTTEADIDTQALAEKWGVARMGVVAMVGATKRAKTLYEDMQRVGYEDTEFSVWGYSSA